MSETISANKFNNPNGLSFDDEGEISTSGELIMLMRTITIIRIFLQLL